MQADGKILVAHVDPNFNQTGGTYVTRLNVNGSIDDGFRGGITNRESTPRRNSRSLR